MYGSLRPESFLSGISRKSIDIKKRGGSCLIIIKQGYFLSVSALEPENKKETIFIAKTASQLCFCKKNEQ